MIQFNEQELAILRQTNKEHINLRNDINKHVEFLMKTQNNAFFLKHKKSRAILELDEFDSYEEILAYHKRIISKYRIILLAITFLIFILIRKIFDLQNFIAPAITSFIIALFITFSSSKRDFSSDILFFLKKSENGIRSFYEKKQKLKENALKIWDIAGEKMVDFIHSQPMVSVYFLKENGFGEIHVDIIELILNTQVDNENYEIVELADPKHPKKTVKMYKSKQMAKNITTTHLQID